MPTTSPPRTARSFADLGRLFTGESRPGLDSSSLSEPRVLRDPPREVVGFGPYIPCAMCGMGLKYSLAVPRVIDDEDGFAGFTHPVGTCDPSDVKAYRARMDLQTERNAIAEDIRRKREGTKG